MKKFLITEDERRHILGLYGLIKEDIDPEVGGTLSVKTNYKSGYYTMRKEANLNNQETGKEIVNQLGPVIEFIRKNPDSIVDILLIAQESAIPNYDMEKVKKQTWLDEGVLSEWRKEYLNEFFQNYFNQLKQTGYISKSVLTPPVRLQFKKPETPFEGSFCPPNSSIQIQRTTCLSKWKAMSKANPNSPERKEYDELKKKYNAEQNSEILITVKKNQNVTTTPPVSKPTQTPTPSTPPPDCATGLKIRIFVERHNCQNAEFLVFANQTLLTNTKGGFTANLNNSDTKMSIPTSRSGTKLSKKMLNPGYGKLLNGDETTSYDGNGDLGKYRSDTFIVTEEQSKSIIAQGNGYITIWMIATTRTAHRDIQDVEITKNDKLVWKGKVKAVQSKLLTMNACGDELVKGEVSVEAKVPDYDKYINQIRRDRAEGSSQDSKQGDAGEDDTKQITLERSYDLVQKMKIVLEDIKNAPTNKMQNEEFLSKLEQNYNYFIQKLNEEPKFTRDSSGKYTDETIRKNELFNDVRLDLKLFYEGFNGVYLGETPRERPGTKCPETPMYNSKGALLCNGKLKISQLKKTANDILSKEFTKL